MAKYLTILLFFPIIAFGQTGNSAKWKKYKKSGYSVEYPSNWEFDGSGQMGTSFIIFSPLESTKDQFRENINLVIQDLTGQNIDLKHYTELSEEQIKTLMPNSVIIESKRIINGSYEYHKILYNSEQNGTEIMFEQYYTISKNKAYIITFTSQMDTFEQYKETGEKILNSFKVK